ncbi:MAG TPA: chromosome segregation protein SMC [Candidatus Nanoarchaeia archaeon]|nr:chromosome segregation protein SMC [Candidatus Nanoarchaeia archaeon]
MTKINKLVMHGFKSFAKRTELVFGDQFNCVLGPNGSGKSNVLDALCFVLGKSSAKALRTEKSSHLIYNGGKSKKPAEFAEVSIVFDNAAKTFPTTDPEVKISRKVKQNGQSVYRINDEARSRQEIVELLSLANIDPDSYNIILQGDITGFVEMQPEERRKLIEDIAGISVYEDKKLKALAEMQRVEERLNEAEIVLKERKERLSELRKEKEQATKHKDLSDKIKTNKASLLSKRINSKKEEFSETDQKIASHKEKLAERQKEINAFKDEIKALRFRIDQINREIEQKGEKEQVDLNKNIEKLKVDIASSKNRKESAKNEILKVQQRRQQLKKNLEDLSEKIGKIDGEKGELKKKLASTEKELAFIDRRIEEFRKKNNLDSLNQLEKDIDSVDKEAEDKQKEIQDLRQRQQELLREKDRFEVQIQALDEKLLKVKEVEKDNKGKVDELKGKKEEFRKLTAELAKRSADSSSLISQLENARLSLLRSQEELSKLRTRQLSVQEKLGENSALKKILDQKQKIQGIYGTVSELGEVSSKYGLALEIAAGPKVTSVVVEDDKVASQCIKYLKDNKLGIVTFLPLNKIQQVKDDAEATAMASGQGVHGFAIKLITYEPKFRNVFSYVFGNTLVVESIETARRLGIGKAKMVSLDGDLAEKSGAMQGGYRRQSSGLGFAEKEIEVAITNMNKREEDAQMLLDRLENDRQENEKAMSFLREKKANLEGEIISIEKQLHLALGDTDVSQKQRKEFNDALKEVEKRIEQVISQINSSNNTLAQNRVKRQEVRSRINELRNPALLAELNAFEEKRDQLREEQIKVTGEVTNYDSQVENILKPEHDNIQKVMKQNEKEVISFTAEIELIDKTVIDFSVDLKQKEEKQRQFESQFKGLFVEKGKIDEKVKKNEEKAELSSEQTREIEQKITALDIGSAQARTELNVLSEEFKQYEGVEVIVNKSEQDMRKDIGIAEGVLTKLGFVNMKSLEIFDQVENEYNALTSKKETLILEKQDVLVMINEIELKKKDSFRETFGVVNDHFKTIFSALSTKGEASLVLENEESPFEGGLLVKVKMAGTRFMDIRSLSGGEKTMTALAFIFAIQEFDPASFYVFDEVDAALDKKNSEKLSQLVKKYSEKAQYIIISHNDGIITEANTLYGVSMDEHGASNVVSLRI